MKYLLSVCALFALLCIGCGEGATTATYNGPSGKVMEVDRDALASTFAANELTVVDFTSDS